MWPKLRIMSVIVAYLPDFFALIGLMLLAAGLYLYSLPLALIIVGSLLMIAGIGIEWNRKRV